MKVAKESGLVASGPSDDTQLVAQASAVVLAITDVVDEKIAKVSGVVLCRMEGGFVCVAIC